MIEEYTHNVKVWDREVEIVVSRKSKTVWIASGTVNHLDIIVRRSNRGAAVKGWLEAAGAHLT